MSQPLATLSVDFEFFSHLPAYRSADGSIDERAVGLEGVVDLLDAFEAANSTGTFFTVSDVSDSYSDTIKRISSDGHEIASHTHTHRHLSELNPSDRYEELATSKERLESVTGKEVTGFRAPSFDITDGHFEDLATIGYSYDSSVVPCRSIPGWYGGECEVQRPTLAGELGKGRSTEPSSSVVEVPIGVMPALRLPLTGTWIRFFGVTYTILGMRLLARNGIPPVLYVHPWELVDLPSVKGVPSRVYVRTGDYMRRAIRKILAQPFDFVTVEEITEKARLDAGKASVDGG